MAAPDVHDGGGKLPGDTVDGTDPVAFSLAFVTAMRKERGLVQIPSLRTTLAIPRFLSARWFRLRALVPRDYLDAAVLCTPPEDQHVAERVARAILFPKTEEVVAVVTPATAAAAPAPAPTPAANPLGSLLGDLQSLDIDLDAIGNFGDLDALLDEAEQGGFQSFDLYESLHQATDPADKALGSLLGGLGGPGDLEAAGVETRPQAVDFAREQLRARIGDLKPSDLVHGAAAGFGPMLLTEVKAPWELAGAMAGTGRLVDLEAHLKDVLTQGSTRDIGRTLKFLEPHSGVLTGSELTAFRETGLARARDLTDHAELVDGVGRWLQPDPKLVISSAVDNVTRALEAARWIEANFGEPLQARVFEAWADVQTVTPALDQLIDLVVPSPRWEGLVDDAYANYIRDLGVAPVLAGGPVGEA